MVCALSPMEGSCCASTSSVAVVEQEEEEWEVVVLLASWLALQQIRNYYYTHSLAQFLLIIINYSTCCGCEWLEGNRDAICGSSTK